MYQLECIVAVQALRVLFCLATAAWLHVMQRNCTVFCEMVDLQCKAAQFPACHDASPVRFVSMAMNA